MAINLENNQQVRTAINISSENQETPTSSFSFYTFLVLTFIVIGRPQDIFKFLQPIRPSLIFVLINVTLIIFQGRRVLDGLFERSIGKKYLYFYGMMIASIPFAYYRKGAFEFVFFQYSINILYFCLFIIHIHSYERVKAFAFTIVWAICFYGLASLHGGISAEGRYTFGSMYDPNDLAYLFVSLMSFTAFFMTGNGRIVSKLFALFTSFISLILIVYTGSRAGMIGLVILLFMFLFTNISPVKKPIKIALLVGIIIFSVSYSNKIFTERNATILNPGSDYNTFDEEGRIQLWKKAIQFTFERPLTGVGAMCYPNAIGLDREQRRIPGRWRWQEVHSAYLQISSELGLIAFILYILLLKESFIIFSKIRRSTNEFDHLTDKQRLAGVIQISFISHIIVAFFLTQGYSIIFTLYFALAATMEKMQISGEG